MGATRTPIAGITIPDSTLRSRSVTSRDSRFET
jgi:hypothetical protein